MRIALILAMQAAPDAAPAFDLTLLPHRRQRCEAAAVGEISVCGGRDPDRYRLKPLPPGDFADKPARAETGLAGGTIGIVTEQRAIGNAVSNRAMIRFKLKF